MFSNNKPNWGGGIFIDHENFFIKDNSNVSFLGEAIYTQYRDLVKLNRDLLLEY